MQQKLPPDYVCLLARALLTVLRHHGYAVPTNYPEHGKAEGWIECVQQRFPGPAEFAPFHLEDSLDGWKSQCEVSGGLHKDLRNLVLLKAFPNEDTLARLAGMIVLGSKELIRRDHNPPSTFLLHIREELREQLLSYRTSILRAFRSHAPPASLPAAEDFFKAPLLRLHFPADQDPVRYDDIEFYVTATKHNVMRYFKQCDSQQHQHEFSRFLESLNNLLENCAFLRDYQDLTDFRDQRQDITALAFETELRLLETSLKSASTATSFYFSDDGFAQAKGLVPVWNHERHRRKIVELLGRCRHRNPKLTFCRVLLLDSLDPSAFTHQQLYNLAVDLELLLRNNIDVALSTRRFAQEVVDELFNIAIGSDGNFMQACANHVQWSLGKISTTSPTFKGLFKKYSIILREAEASKMVFKSDYYVARNDWHEKTLEDRRIDPVLRDLQDRLCNFHK